MQRNNIQVLTIGYIDSDEFWPRIFRQQRLGKINKADNDNLLAAKIIFVPVATDGPPTGYTTTLELTGKTSQVYELLSISQAEVDSIAASTSQQQLGSATFATPNEAKETVVSALIAALQRVETNSKEVKDEITANASLEGIQKIIIKEALASARENIEEWQKAVEENIERPWEKLNACFVDREAGTETILENIQKLTESVDDFLKQLAADENNSELLKVIGLTFLEKVPPFYPELSDGVKTKLLEMVCPFIIEDTEEERPELVTIEPIEDRMFAPGIGEDSLSIHYSIQATERFPLQYAKVEIFKNDGTLAYLNDEDLPITQEGVFIWDGKMNQGASLDKFIRFDESPFEIRISASLESGSDIEFVSSIESDVEEEVDEWNDNTGMQNWVLCTKIVGGKEVQCNNAERYAKYKEASRLYKSKFKAIEETNPLEYFKDKITFDTESSKYTFLEQTIRVHKKFYPYLKQVENAIIQNYGNAVYKEVVEKYDGLINDFAIRKINNGSTPSTDLSPHSLGLAVDIDSKRNPQIIFSERPLAFFVIRYFTGTNFDPGAPKVSGFDTKRAHSIFLNKFKEINSVDFTNVNSYSHIDLYNKDSRHYPIDDLDNDVIKNSLDVIKTNLNTILDLIAKKKQSENTGIVIETTINQIESRIYSINELKNVIEPIFDRAIFSTAGKASIAYLDDVYLATILLKLSDLKDACTLLRNDYNDADLSSINKLREFVATSFSIDFVRIQPVADEYFDFVSALKLYGYDGFDVYGKDLLIQFLNRDFGNELGKDGFCDMSESLMEGILLDLFSNITEWGGHYNGKKDWMHFGIPGRNYNQFINE
ncbi:MULTISPECIES: hypothetical protein [unclassified Imperialibacter]|uniref:hypothetical protein n=1 Tax=unclassified Imperialibacter TaxID=2629706 RepID=UPI00125EBE40|nr:MULTISPECIES: hypothetical protein [unclassified Imperialibacter]